MIKFVLFCLLGGLGEPVVMAEAPNLRSCEIAAYKLNLSPAQIERQNIFFCEKLIVV